MRLITGYIGLTQAAVRKRLAEKEALELQQENAPIVHEDISPSVLINTGMEFEEQQ
jgi:hypothetical protein